MSQSKLRKVTLSINELVSIYGAMSGHYTFLCHMIRKNIGARVSYGLPEGYGGVIQNTVRDFLGKYFEFSPDAQANECTIPLWFVEYNENPETSSHIVGWVQAKNGMTIEFLSGYYSSNTSGVRITLLQHIAKFHPDAVMEFNF